MKEDKIFYIDGLRGIGALIVFFCHFTFAFYYGLYSLRPEHSHTATNVEAVIGKSPLNIFYSGNFAVRLFLVVSGFVLCYHYFQNYEKKRLIFSGINRYIRLVIPIIFVNLAAFVLMYLGLYKNSEASMIAKSKEWFYGFNHFTPNLFNAMKEAVFGCFFFSENKYNGVLWTVKYLFLGALLVYVLAYFIGQWKYRYVIYILLIGALCLTDYAGILIGFFLCDIVCTKGEIVDKLRRYPLLSWIVFIVGFYFGSYPSYGEGVQGTIYGIFKVPLVVPFHLLGAVLMFTAVLLNKTLQTFFSNKVFIWLGKVSYSLYLVHFMIIATFSSWFILTFYQRLGYPITVAIDFIITSLIVLSISALMQKYIEGSSKKLLIKRG